MVSLGALSFAVPWALAALIVLPAIWWLLRLTPPIPKKIMFPPIRLLFGIVTDRETSARTPWWLLVLRLALASLIIFAAARPLLNAERAGDVSQPMLLVVDNGWAAADGWDRRREVALSLTDRALRAGRRVVLLATAPPTDGSAIEVIALGAAEARSAVNKLLPLPWPTDRGEAADALADWQGGFAALADVRWLTDGLDGPGTEEMTERLRGLGTVTVYIDPLNPIIALRPPTSSAAGLSVTLERTHAVTDDTSYEVRGLDGEGRVQATTSVTFGAAAADAIATLEAPVEILNRIERLQIADGAHVGAVVLLDQRWRRRPVGILTADNAADVQPLLSSTYYIERALQGSTSVRSGNFRDVFAQPLSVLAVPDGVDVPGPSRAALNTWIEEGGILVRFAGPALARHTSEIAPGQIDPLLPVQLRAGDRVIGGAMSWQKPMGLMPFTESSPFNGLSIPSDVRIGRQVLAQPTPALAAKTWAALEDGTPLVTADKRGRGWVVLFHTAANTSWSNLPLSGLFVEMMQRLSALGLGVAGVGDVPPLAPLQIMDAFARLGPPAANVQPIDAKAVDQDLVSQAHPPGIYGAKDLRRAFNLTTSLPPLSQLPLNDDMIQEGYEKPAEHDLTPWIFLAALVLFMLDMLAGLWVRGGGRRLGMAAGVVAMLMLGGGLASPAHAAERFALENSLETRLAYLQTGDARVDDVSARGLGGLTVMLARRTAAELGPPQPVQPGRDDLTFFPLIYWPVTAFYELDDVARLAVKEYLRNGGTILFDTQERGGGAQAAALRDLAQGLDLPPLVPVGKDHVLTRSFYLLDAFPGRYAGAALWVERAGERVNDGVSPVVAGSSDWASAWALDETQRPIFPVVPGGERQREMAFRFGINLVMYVLTGNYKADQVHMPAIIKRLGQ